MNKTQLLLDKAKEFEFPRDRHETFKEVRAIFKNNFETILKPQIEALGYNVESGGLIGKYQCVLPIKIKIGDGKGGL